MVNQKQNTNQIYVFTATTTSQRIFAANKNRKSFAIYNNGSNIVEFSLGQAYGFGYPLAPSEEISDDHFNPQGELFVIATGGNTELRVWEIISMES